MVISDLGGILYPYDVPADVRQFIEKFISEDVFIMAMENINSCISELYELLIEPFADIDRFGFE